MHDEKDYQELERRLAASAPPVAEDATIERVLATSRTKAGAVGAPRRPFGRPAWQFAVAAAVLVIGVAVGMRYSLRGPELTMAFAKQDAIAALIPQPGNVLHLKTTEWAQNYGEDTAVLPGTEYQETWSDFDGQRGHTYWRTRGSDKLVSEAVVADGRARLRLYGTDLEPGMTPLSEGPAPEGIIGGEFFVYEYIRESLPEGKVVGEVTIDGERYWDMRWENVRDEGGLKLNARALFRQPDYRPLRIERDYPGGSKSVWEVLEWEVVPLSKVNLSMFELASIPSSDVLEERLYLLPEIGKFDEFGVWWLGEKLGELPAQRQENLVDRGDHTETVLGDPQFWYRRGAELVGDPLTGGAQMSIPYAGSGLETVTVTSMRPVADDSLAELLAKKVGAGAEVEKVQTAAGPAVIARPAGDRMRTALVCADGALVMIETRDEAAMDAALKALRRARPAN